MSKEERKKVIEKMAEQFMSIEDTNDKSMAVMLMSVYAEGKAAGKQEERQQWEKKEATTA